MARWAGPPTSTMVMGVFDGDPVALRIDPPSNMFPDDLYVWMLLMLPAPQQIVLELACHFRSMIASPHWPRKHPRSNRRRRRECVHLRWRASPHWHFL